jgi:predicted Rdx family selenoprotein
VEVSRCLSHYVFHLVQKSRAEHIKFSSDTKKFAQELLSTFSTALGEVALQPSTGGIFTVHLYHAPPRSDSSSDEPLVQKHLLWDRKAEGGFPGIFSLSLSFSTTLPSPSRTGMLTSDAETKELKRRVRDIIDPSRNLGHVDSHKTPMNKTAADTSVQPAASDPLPRVQGSTLPAEGTATSSAPPPKAMDHLQNTSGDGDRRSTSGNLAASSRPLSTNGGGEQTDKVVIGAGEGVFYCKPGDEDCG